MSIPCSAWEFGGAIRQQAREAEVFPPIFKDLWAEKRVRNDAPQDHSILRGVFVSGRGYSGCGSP